MMNRITSAVTGLTRRMIRRLRARQGHAALLRFYRQFIAPGGLCFDVGAHQGNKAALFLALGGRVVAVEPQQDCIQRLRDRFGTDPQLTIVQAGLGATHGFRELWVHPGESELASFSPDWSEVLNRHQPGLASDQWQRIQTRMETLDRLIAQFGTPDYLKIDVEGFEAEVLVGLSVPVRNLSFEVLPFCHRAGIDSLRQLDRLGDYQFNHTFDEALGLASARWVGVTEMQATLTTLHRAGGPACDVFACLTSGQRQVGPVTPPEGLPFPHEVPGGTGFAPGRAHPATAEKLTHEERTIIGSTAGVNPLLKEHLTG